MAKFSRQTQQLSAETIRTERLVLKPVSLDDEYGFYLMRSDPDVMHWLPLEPITDRDEHKVDYLDAFENAYERRAKFIYAIHWPGDKNSEAEEHIIGIVILRPLEDGSKIEAGYWIRKDFWGRGIAGEAQQGMFDHQLDHLDATRTDVMAVVDVGNDASRRVLEKLGFQYTHTADFEDCPCWFFELTP